MTVDLLDLQRHLALLDRPGLAFLHGPDAPEQRGLAASKYIPRDWLNPSTTRLLVVAFSHPEIGPSIAPAADNLSASPPR